MAASDFHRAGDLKLAALDGAPRIELQDTPYGFCYAAIRKTADPTEHFVRITPFILPFHTIVPFPKHQPRNFHAWVPIDDENTWTYFMHYSSRDQIDPEAHRAPFDLNEHYQKKRNLLNMHLQDREMMKSRNFSGIPHIPTQDHAVQESMGPIVDRSKERLGTSDIAVIHLRKLLLKVVREFIDGKEPPARDPTYPFDRIDSDSVVAPLHKSWQELAGL